MASENEALSYEEIDLLELGALPQEGANVLSVEVHQTSAASADLVWDAELSYSTVTPPADSDMHGISDDWELANGLNPSADPGDALLDFDGDGASNAADLSLEQIPTTAAQCSRFVSHLKGTQAPIPKKSEIMTTLKGFLEEGTLKPVIDRTYPLSEAAEAIRYLHSGKALGRINITPWRRQSRTKA